MDLLEHYHENPPQNGHYTLRKTSLPLEGNVNLHGARGSGKTSLVLDYLWATEKKVLYIDLEDPNLILNTLETLPLQDFIDEHTIEELILDHYEEGMIEVFPRIKRLILVSRIPLKLSGFQQVQLHPLDYEEFLAFDHAANANNAFNRFLKCGTLPAMAKQAKNTTLLMKQFFQQQFSANEQALMLILARYHSQPMTTHQIYSFAKEHFKISKDFVYSTIKRLQEEELLYFIEDAEKRSGKKMILYDFAFAKYLTVNQPFGVQFDSMVALTLLKHRVNFRTLGIHGYLTDTSELIIPAPFESEERFWIKAQKKFSLFKKHHITKVTIISVANSYDFDIEKLHFEAVPFNEWSIAHTEEEA
jgi:hypothetical protein